MRENSTPARRVQQTPLASINESKRALAIGYAELGLPVFPLAHNGKTPALTGDWKAHATIDPNRVADLWTCPVTDAELDYNIGIATGRSFGGGFLMVADIDTGDGKTGDKSLALLEETHGELPATFTVRTASGGNHLYFLSGAPVGNSASKIGDYIDIKGLNGYVVGPGSTIDGKTYSLETATAIPHAPEWLVKLAGAPRERQHDNATPLVDLDSETAIRRAIEYLRYKAPDSGTYRVATKVKDFGVSEEVCIDLMMEHWPPAEAKGIEHITLRVRNAYRYGQNAPGIASAEAEFDAVEIHDRPSNPIAPPLGGWQPPADLWECDRAPCEPREGCAPRYVERFAEDRARRLGVDSGAMTAATITALSSLVPAGNNLHMRQHSDSWSVKCVIWTAIIGDPGTAKSPAVNAALAFPRAVDHVWRAEYAKARERFELSQPQPKSGRRKRQPEKVAVSVEAPAIETADELFLDGEAESLPTSEPHLRRKIVNDATTEALGSVLAGCPDAAPVLLHSDELAGIIGGMDAYRSRGSKDRPFFLSAKEGASFAIDRKSSGATIVPALAISIVGTIQDDKLSKIAPTLTDDGFFQRFAPVMIRKTGRGVDVPDDPEIDRSISRIALALAELETRDYRLAPEAAVELDAVNDFVETECGRFDLSPALKTWLSKTPNEFGRYCLAFHLIEWATGMGPALDLPPESLVSRATAVQARRYVQEFLFSHAKYVYGTVMAKAQDDDDVQWVAGYILTRGLSTITAREIGRAYRSLRGSDKRAKLRSVMATLGLQDWVKVTNTVRGEWSVNPAVHDGRFEAIKEAEALRRAAVRAEIAVTAAARRSEKEEQP